MICLNGGECDEYHEITETSDTDTDTGLFSSKKSVDRQYFLWQTEGFNRYRRKQNVKKLFV